MKSDASGLAPPLRRRSPGLEITSKFIPRPPSLRANGARIWPLIFTRQRLRPSSKSTTQTPGLAGSQEVRKKGRKEERKKGLSVNEIGIARTQGDHSGGSGDSGSGESFAESKGPRVGPRISPACIPQHERPILLGFKLRPVRVASDQRSGRDPGFVHLPRSATHSGVVAVLKRQHESDSSEARTL